VTLKDVILCPAGEGRGLYLVFDWAEFELSEILKTHREKKEGLDEKGVKSIMWQILNGIAFLHQNWVIHRDLKPANILIMGKGPAGQSGRVRIADFGMARLFQQPLRSLHSDGVVVTVWYRAPELLLGAKHYSKAIDMWAIGCIFGELLTKPPGPLFQGVEEKHHFQKDQLVKIFNVVGKPTPEDWRQISQLHEWHRVTSMELDPSKMTSLENKIEVLKNPNNAHALDLIKSFFHYDPAQRMTALKAIKHKYFTDTFDFNPNCVWRTPPSTAGLDIKYYPERPLTQVGMHGQSMGPAGAASSAHYNNNAHKRAAPGGKCLCVCLRTRAYVYEHVCGIVQQRCC
jgi:cyclin-dependent kinase 8/11